MGRTENDRTAGTVGSTNRAENAAGATETPLFGQTAPPQHPFARWMRPTTNASKARSTWEEAELEGYWMQLLADADRAQEAKPTPQADSLWTERPGKTRPTTVVESEQTHLFREQGWASSKPVFSATQMRRVVFLGDSVRQAGWPRVFAYLYEELWQILRSPHCQRTLSTWLGEDHHQRPGLWFHQVPPVSGARGWGPHVDSATTPDFDASGRPERLTIWIPLVDVDVDRACMFVVPTDETPPALAQRILSDENLPIDLVLRLLHAGRPVPCQAGSLLAWRPDVLHWGGVHRGHTGARHALSLEFARPHTPLHAEEEMDLAGDEIPDFSTRLFLVARALLAYGKSKEREPHAHGFLGWAEAMYRRHHPANRERRSHSRSTRAPD